MTNETAGRKSGSLQAFEVSEEKMAGLKDRAAEILKISPEALEKFENSYKIATLNETISTGDLMDEKRPESPERPNLSAAEKKKLANVIGRIVCNLIRSTEYIEWDGSELRSGKLEAPKNAVTTPVSRSEIMALPESLRPQLTESMMTKQLPCESYPALLSFYDRFVSSKDVPEKALSYDMFRQGLDILDLDPILYDMLGMNPNSIGKWLPALCLASKSQDFFRIPKTRVAKIPMPLLQLSRLDYESLTKTTLDVVDYWAMSAFDLDASKSYFIKTGTYSSKFDFRNARVPAGKEILSLGEYLLYIQHQAVAAAGPLSSPSIYGMSTTNEWAAREYIEPEPGSLEIYKGLPLRPEYRVFVDIEDRAVIGMSPYWEPRTMLARLGAESDADSPYKKHDYVIFRSAQDWLMSEYRKNAGAVEENIRNMLPALAENGLSGQWSIDVMQEKDTFYVIDMALARNSALSDCVPLGRLKPIKENWIPEIK